MSSAKKTSRSRRTARPTRKSAPAVRLLSDAELRRIAARIFKFSPADETEVTVESTTDALTRFANNTIHQHVAEQITTVSIRTVFDGRTARASTNRLDDDSLRQTVAASSALARSQQKIPGLLPMPGPQKYAKVDRFFPATAHATPDDRARVVARICQRAAAAKQTAAGIFSTGASQSAIANSRGLFASYRQTKSEFSITILESDSSGWAKANFPNLADLDPEALAARAAEKSAASRKPREVAPGRFTVILEPSAVLDLVGFLFYDFAGTAVLDQRSCFNDRLGKALFGSNITLHDDVAHRLQTGAPFDGEGMPRQKVLLVEKGVPKNLVYARSTAKKMNARPTGHGLPLPNDMGEAPMNLVLAGGDSSLEKMIASTDRGILVTRLWYIREVDPYEKILTGMTRDGTFLIEGGKLAGGIRNFRFNQSLIELLSSVEALGPSIRSSGEESFDMVVPPVKARNFHFSEATKF